MRYRTSTLCETWGYEICRRCMVLQLVNSFSAAQKLASPRSTSEVQTGNLFRQSVENKPPRASGSSFGAGTTRLGLPAGFHYSPQPGDIDVGKSGRGHACMPGHRASLGCPQGPIRCPPLLLALRGTDSPLHHSRVCRSRGGRVEKDGDANRNGSCSNFLMLHWVGCRVC
jgi:hypothetical protein